MKVVRTFGLALLFCSMAAMLGAQGVQTGTVRGVVQDEQGLAVVPAQLGQAGRRGLQPKRRGEIALRQRVGRPVR